MLRLIHRPHLLFLLAYLISSSNLIGIDQVHIDTLLKQIKFVPDTHKVDIYNKLAYSFVDSSFSISNTYIDSAKQLAILIDYDLGIYEADYNGSRNLALQNQYPSAINKINSLQSSLDYEDKNHLYLIAKSEMLLGWISERVGSYYEAINHYDKAYKHFLLFEDASGLPNVVINIGIIYARLEEHDIALKYYKKADTLYQNISNKRGLVYVNNNIGHIHQQRGNYQEAIKYYRKGIELAQELGFNRLSATLNQNLGEIYKIRKEYKTALEYINKSIIYDELLGDERSLAYGKTALAEVQHLINPNKPQFETVKTAFNLSKSLKDYELQSISSGLLSQMYADVGNYKSALEFKAINEAIKDSIQKNDLKVKLRNLELEKKYEAKQLELKVEQASQNASYQAQIDKQSLISWFLIIGMLFIIGLAYLYYKLYHSALSAKMKLEEQNITLLDTEIRLAKKNSDLKRYIDLNMQLEQFAHILSHDIKSPLRTISSYVGLLKKKLTEQLSSKEEQHFSVIEKSTKRLNNLVDDLLQFSKTNSQDLNISKFELSDLLNEVVEDLDYRIQSIDALISFKNTQIIVFADKIKLKQIIQNLLDNSLKFHDPSRQSEIIISASETESYYEITIRDNGVGIPDEYFEKVFDQFTQLHTKDNYEGTGLGLSICKNYVQKHGGEISLKKNESHGVSISFTIAKSTKKLN